MNNELADLEQIDIKSLIYTIRGRQVMIDSDVAMLYECETKRINEKVKRNIKRFPEDFCFQLTEDEFLNFKVQFVNLDKNANYEYEVENLESLDEIGVKPSRSQFATLNKMGRGQNRKYLPYAYTEQGISMLSPLLNSDITIEASIRIMRAFVEMRKFINTNKDLFERVVMIENKIDQKFTSYDKKFKQIFNDLQNNEDFKQKIFFEGQIYDAYSLIIDIIKKAKKK